MNAKKSILQLSIMLSIAAAILLSGCMSLSRAGDEEIENILSMINEGRHQQLNALCGNPFLLDSEILQGTSLTGMFWAGLAESGFSLTDPEVSINESVTIGHMEVFGSAYEIKTFFNKYVPRNSVIVGIDSNEGKSYLILIPAEGGIRKIAAWGGPY